MSSVKVVLRVWVAALMVVMGVLGSSAGRMGRRLSLGFFNHFFGCASCLALLGASVRLLRALCLHVACAASMALSLEVFTLARSQLVEPDVHTCNKPSLLSQWPVGFLRGRTSFSREEELFQRPTDKIFTSFTLPSPSLFVLKVLTTQLP
jgi:hypothetical protein